jgi:pyruvate dehydrogenase E2 component (dihydrolipoyllysine-residue acetyltransferase)
MASEFKLPELGENVEKGDVVRVLVAAGDTIGVDQPVLELETDKATIEVPSTVAGKVSDVRVKSGDKVSVGQVVLVVEPQAAGAPAQSQAVPSPAAGDEEQKMATAAATPEGEATPAATAAPPPAASPAAPARTQAKPADVVDISAGRAAQPGRPGDGAGGRGEPGSANVAARQSGGLELAPPVPAAPSVRRFARDLGVDIGQVPGTGPGGRIGPDDVKQHVRTIVSGPIGRANAAPLPDFSKWGEVEVKPMSNIRRKTAEQLTLAWQAPHVTQHDKADITSLEAFRTAHAARVERAGGKLTVTAILIKIVAAALQRFPQFAASPDLANDAIVYKKYCHIGVAVDTPNGLLVPVIRDADTKTIAEIAADLAVLSQRAREKKLSLDDMSGGVFSISNLGGIGGTAFTPIVNQPEVAILGVSRASREPVWMDGQFVPREMLPLSLSYDHRVIDGADAARFLRFVVDALEQPLTMVL